MSSWPRLPDWIAARGGLEPAEIGAGIAQVRRFIEVHGDARFAPMIAVEDEKERILPNRAGFRRGGDGAREWLILPETWKPKVAAGYDAGLLARAMVERGMMKA